MNIEVRMLKKKTEQSLMNTFMKINFQKMTKKSGMIGMPIVLPTNVPKPMKC